MKHITSDMFQLIDIPHRAVKDSALSKYRVFRDETHYITVEAQNAQMALVKSGIKPAHKIVQDAIMLRTIIAVDAMELPLQHVSVLKAEEQMPSAQQADASLSGDDVDKLLNS